MARTIAVVSHKGGVGKSVTVCNMATVLAEKEKRVAVIDFDSQGHICKTFGIDKNNLAGKTIFEAIIGEIDLKDIVIKTDYGVDVYPSTRELYNLEDTVRDSRNKKAFPNKETVLKDTLEEINSKYQYILIDLPPSFNLYTVNGLVAADDVLIPVVPEGLAVDGAFEAIDSIQMVKKAHNPKLNIMGLLLTQVTPTTLHGEVTAIINQHFEGQSIKPFKTVIRRSIKYGEASTNGVPAVAYDKKYYMIADYYDFVKEALGVE